MDIKRMIGRSVTARAWAKINLTLQVTEKLSCGLHLLQSLMCPIDFADDVSVKITECPGISLNCSFADEFGEHCRALALLTPKLKTSLESLSTESNLASLAAKAFLERVGLSDKVGIIITLHKRIPLQAGLGGGSSDAAAVLRSLGQLFGYPVSSGVVQDIACRLGSDVLPQLTNQLVFAFGTGRNIVPVTIIASAWNIWREIAVVVVKPLLSIDTPGAYRSLEFEPSGLAQLDECNRLCEQDRISEILNEFSEVLVPMGLHFEATVTSHQNDNKKLTLLEQEGSHAMPAEALKTANLFDSFVNDFEKALLKSSSGFSELFELLKASGAERVLLAGSGSAVLGFSSSLAGARLLAERIRRRVAPGWFVHTAKLHLAGQRTNCDSGGAGAEFD